MSTTSTSSISTTSSGGNVLRITGLASGLDVDATVKAMMTAEQTKIDKANQDKQSLQWKQDAYNDIISNVKDLQSSFFDVASSDNNLMSTSTYAAFDITGNNAAVANVTTGVGTQTGNYTLKVASLATGAAFTQYLTGASSIALTSKLTDITNVGTGANLKDSLNLVLDVKGGDTNSSAGGKTLNININNSAGDLTVKNLVDSINSQGNGLIKASYSELTQKISLTTVATGAAQTLTYNGGSTSLALTSLFGATSSTATNADVFITEPGQTEVEVKSQATNNFSIDGMNYNLTGVNTTGIALNVTQNTQKVYDKVKAFIDKYNILVDKIETKLTDKKNVNYKPLTDAQKASMTDAAITAWNTKAQVGALRNDDNLQKMLTDLKTAFTTSVSGTALSVGKYGSNSFGLDTSGGYSKPYEMTISDPVKLKNAIAQNPDQFIKLFTNVSSSTDTATQYKENGIFTRIQGILETNVGKTGIASTSAVLSKYATFQDNYSNFGSTGLNTILDQMYAKDVLIKSLNKSFTTKQTAYYTKFSALEVAMNKLNNQSSSLTSMLGQ